MGTGEIHGKPPVLTPALGSRVVVSDPTQAQELMRQMSTDDTRIYSISFQLYYHVYSID